MTDFFLGAPVLALVVLSLWIALALYGLSAVWWLVETVVLARGYAVDPDEAE
nr:hypothetical protein [Halalkalicoccus subterraneus]